MPQIYFERPSRRNFLQASASAVGLVLTARRGLADETPYRDHWALLSDTHIPANIEEAYNGFRPYDNLKQIIPDVVRSKPSGVMICGDVARLEGLPGDYERVKELLAPVREVAPTVMALGNHDHRDNFRAAFADAADGESRVRAGGKHVVVIEQQPVRMIVLDSLFTVNETPGFLGKQQRDWLARYLAASDDTPTAIFVHHTLGDGDGELIDVPRLFELVEPVKKVKAILFGHSHVYSYAEREGIHLINLPAVGYSFDRNQPVGWVDAEWTCNGANLRLYAIGGNQEKHGELVELAWR